MRRIIPILIIASGAALLAHGQAPSQTAAVPVTGEPHHHLVHSDENVRAFDVEVPAHSSTMLHQHDVDYIWVALGDADVINAVAGKPEARLQIKDGTVHFTRGGFAHVARNESDSAFRNVTIELLKPQTNPRNYCDEALPGAPTDCKTTASENGARFIGATLRLEFATDQVRVGELSIEPGKWVRVPGSRIPLLFVTMEGTEAQAVVSMPVAGGAPRRGTRNLKSGDIVGAIPVIPMEILNSGNSAARFLVLDFKSGKH